MPPIPPESRQRRAMVAVVAMFAGGITLILLLVLLTTDDGPNTRAVDTASDRTTSTSSRRIPVPTSFSPATFPPVSAQTAPPAKQPPPTVIVIPPTEPPTTQPPPKKAKKQPKNPAPATQPPATQPPATQPPTTQLPTTTNTTRPPALVALEEALETALNGGITPDPTMPARVAVATTSAGRVRITWSLDPTLETPAQKTTARQEAYDLLTGIQSADLPGTGDVILRATLPAPDADAPRRVVRLVFQRTTLDEIDLTTVDPQDVFTLADAKVIAPFLKVAATPASTTTLPTSTTISGR